MGKEHQIYSHVKRGIDIIASGMGLAVAAIPMAVVAAAIKIDSPGPVIFKQERLGVHGKPFYMYKFRSMVVGAEHTGSGVYSGKNDARVTKVGAFIRKTSIDELPQLWNVLVGSMSLVGPRPALTYHPWPFDQYTEHQKHMFDVRPGITGWAQIHGRKEVPWPERIELNIWYVEHMSFALDASIIFKTVGKVLSNADNVNSIATAATATQTKKDQLQDTVCNTLE